MRLRGDESRQVFYPAFVVRIGINDAFLHGQGDRFIIHRDHFAALARALWMTNGRRKMRCRLHHVKRCQGQGVEVVNADEAW